MLDDFIRGHTQQILDRARARIGLRVAPIATYTEMTNGLPLFLEQLEVALRNKREETAAITASAARHGGDLHRIGFTITQVVHDYGDICQAITELADELHTPISIDEFRLLNMCLDEAIAGAVTEFTRLRQNTKEKAHSLELGAFAHELRNKLNAATLAHTAIKSGAVGVGGSTGLVLERNLRGMRDLINGSLAAVRIESGIQHRERVTVFELIEEIEADAMLEATERGVQFSVTAIEHGIDVSVDRAVLVAAVINLLHNAFKFSELGSHISLSVTAGPDRVLFAVQDQCGGLPAGSHDDIFDPFTQRHANRTGVGLGLSISRKGIEAGGGQIRVANLPGEGCIFTIDLPRMAAQAA